jgi:tetratricopeptide (TPR) repeat protein
MSFPSLLLTRHCSLRIAISLGTAFAAIAGMLGTARAQDAIRRLGMPSQTQSPDALFMETLIRQGLPDVAAGVCKQRLSYEPPDSDAYAQWLMLSMYAQSADSLREVDWSQPEAQLDATMNSLTAAVQSASGSPREPWIDWKSTWCRRWVQQRALAALLAVPGRERAKQWTLGSIRKALDDIEASQQIVQKLQPRRLTAAQRRNNSDAIPEITASQILELRGDLELLRADLLYQRSQCYDQGSDDRVAAATEMLSSIDRALQRLPGDWSHRPLLAIARATALLQLGQATDTLRDLDKLWEELQQEDSPHPEQNQWTTQLAAVAARACRETQQWASAEQWLERAGGWATAPELAIEHFAQSLQREPDLNPQSILELKRDLGKRFGPYWELRADALLVSNPLFNTNTSSSPSPGNSASLEIFRIEVRQLLAAKRSDQAIEKLQQAELAASRQSSSRDAFTFAMQIGAVLESLGKPNAASDEFHRAAISYPDQDGAPKAALMSAWLIRTPDPKLDTEAAQWQRATYRQRLIDTALQWPESPSASQAMLWVEQEMLSQEDLPAMLDLWRERIRTHPQPESLLLAASLRCLLAHLLTQYDWLEPSVAHAEKTVPARDALHQAMLDVVPPDRRIPLQSWLNSLRPYPQWPTDSSSNGSPLSPWATDFASAIEYDSKDPIGRFAILWYACDRATSTYWLGPDSERGISIQWLAKLLPNLNEMTDGRSENTADISRSAVALGSKFLERVARSMEYHRICLSVIESDGPAVIAELAKLQSRNKKSLWWLYHTARAMQTLPSHRDSAIALYRQMASGVPGGSDAWLEARARTAQAMRERGDLDSATQLRDLVLATYPDAATVWRGRFDSP